MIRTLRLFLVLLLAALLPIRGAMAAAMLCPQGSHSAAAAHAMAMPAAGHDHAAMLKAQQHHVHDASPAARDDGHAAGCSLCAAFCTMTPMPSAAPAVHAETIVRALAFPVLAAPAPVFESDGPERPPRTL